MDMEGIILRHLQGLDEPCNVMELAHAIGVLEPGDVVPTGLRSTLAALVRREKVERVHSGDGVLRYAAMAPSTPPELQPDQATPRHYELGVGDRVLAALVEGAPPVRRAVIESRTSPRLTTSQVVMALQVLRRKGIVRRHGSTANATWSRVPASQVIAPAVTVSPARVSAAHQALLDARAALDTALKALEA